jgi:lysophospholipase L1-like esterase
VFANQTPDDAHLSPAGHEVLARWLEPTISKALEGW